MRCTALEPRLVGNDLFGFSAIFQKATSFGAKAGGVVVPLADGLLSPTRWHLDLNPKTPKPRGC